MEMKSESNNNKKKLLRKLNKREKTVAIVMLAALLVGLWLPGRIIVSTSASLRHRIFFLVPTHIKKFKNGDYLVFRHKDIAFVRKGLNKKNNRLIKKVGCSPGEILTKDADRQWYCGQNFLGKALEKDGKGRKLPQFKFIGPVPDDNYFMVGTNPRSFDSRYFGFVHAKDILYKALPLW